MLYEKSNKTFYITLYNVTNSVYDCLYVSLSAHYNCITICFPHLCANKNV